MEANAALIKATQLLTLAGNAGASPEEARTAAYLAAKLIKEHGFILAPKAQAGYKPPPPKPGPSAYKPPPPPPKPAPKASPYVQVKAKVYGCCTKCGKNYTPWETVSVKAGNMGTMKGARHVKCV